MKKHLTTSQVAELLSVTPDAVLKWVKLGKLPAQRTPGGHCRIPMDALTQLEKVKIITGEGKIDDKTLFCWQYHAGSSTVNGDCDKCVVYRSQTLRCWELQILPTEIGHKRKYCDITCEECPYRTYMLAR